MDHEVCAARARARCTLWAKLMRGYVRGAGLVRVAGPGETCNGPSHAVKAISITLRRGTVGRAGTPGFSLSLPATPEIMLQLHQPHVVFCFVCFPLPFGMAALLWRFWDTLPVPPAPLG